MIFYVAYSAEARQDLRDIYEYIAYELLVPEQLPDNGCIVRNDRK